MVADAMVRSSFRRRARNGGYSSKYADASSWLQQVVSTLSALVPQSPQQSDLTGVVDVVGRDAERHSSRLMLRPLDPVVQGERVKAEDDGLLGHFFGNSPQFWLNLQALYELRMAGSRAGAEIASLPTLSAP